MRQETHNTWLYWNTDQTAASTGNLITPYQQSSAATYAEYWYRWINEQEETAEQRAERQRLVAQNEERTRAYAAARKAAAERAEKLLEACLSMSQRESLRKNGWFVVFTKSGRGYQIRRGRARNVVEVNTKRTYCCHPFDNVPDADTMLAQKLMLETQEEQFLQLANVS